MNRITTVCGDIAPEKLGVTTMHEHTILKIKLLIKAVLGTGSNKGNVSAKSTGQARNSTRNSKVKMSKAPMIRALLSNSKKYYTRELIAFKKAGGTSLVDATPHGGHGSMLTVQRLSNASGVNIIACTGLYVAPAIPKILVAGGEDAMFSFVENEIRNGIGNSAVKPGFVKCAISISTNEKLSEIESMSIRACAKAAKKYNLSLHMHIQYPLTYKVILDAVDMLIEDIGINPNRLLVCHVDAASIHFLSESLDVNEKGYNPYLATELLKRGINTGFDTWGFSIRGKEVARRLDESRFQLLKEMIQAGYAKQITLGHDVSNKVLGKQAGGYGYTFFLDYLPQRLAKEGMDPNVYCQLSIENPARILVY